MRVHRDQMTAFSEDLVRDFEDRMIQHLGALFPSFVADLRDDELRALIQLGIRRARRHGIIAERGVCIYVTVMFAFGRDFESDPACAWAVEILRDPLTFADPEGRAHRLFETAHDRLMEADGLWGRRNIQSPPPAEESP